MKRTFITILILAASIFANGETGSTSKTNVAEVKVANQSDQVFVYVKPVDDTWILKTGGTTYWISQVYFGGTDQEATNQMLSAVLTAKSTGVNVVFVGTRENDTYFKATEIIVDPK